MIVPLTPKDIVAHLDLAHKIIMTWPNWKRDILEYSSKPTRKVPREIIYYDK